MQIKEKGFTEKFVCMMILIMKGVFKWLSSKLRKIFCDEYFARLNTCRNDTTQRFLDDI